MSDERESARAQLERLLPRVMEDEKLDEAEKRELMGLLQKGLLTPADVKDIFRTYLRALQDDVLQDGLVTDEERRKVQTVVRELRIPRAFLSPEILAIIDG